jgi:hypothetical protein
MQEIINSYREGYPNSEYTEDGAKSIILDKLDEMEIYPDDIDYIFSELNF